MHRNAANVKLALREAGVMSEIQELAASTRTAAEAAEALRCEVGAIANSLVFLADGAPILVLASGAHRVDLRHLADKLSAQQVRRASPDQVRAATGQPIGGVSPVGHPRPVPTVIDMALQDHSVLWAAAGTPNAVFSTTYAELLRMCNARPVTVTSD